MKALKLAPALLILLVSVTVAAQTEFNNQITPGSSRRADVDKALGAPIKQDSANVFEYKPPAGASRLQIGYRADGVVYYLNATFSQGYPRTQLVEAFGLPTGDQPTKIVQNRLTEYFGAPAYLVLNYASAQPLDGVAVLRYDSAQAFAAEAPGGASSSASASTPPAVQPSPAASGPSGVAPPPAQYQPPATPAPSSGSGWVNLFSGIITPGSTARSAVETILGPPLSQAGTTVFQYALPGSTQRLTAALPVFEYKPPQGAAELQVEYQPYLAVNRLAVRFQGPMDRSSIVHLFNPPLQTQGNLNSSSTNAFEFFGAPYFLVLVYASQYTNSGIIAMHYDTQQGFQREFDQLAAHPGIAGVPVLLVPNGHL